MKTKYSIFGLGKLGASMAAAIASRGFDVMGVDVNSRAVDMLAAGYAPVQETGLEELIQHNRDRLHATTDHVKAILHSDVTFVIVPTPADDRGAFSLQYARWAFRQIGHALAQKTEYHNVVLTSTVLPGSTRYGLLPILESESGKKCGRQFGLCYSPAFIALGSVIRDFLHPDFTLVGEFDELSGSQLEECYASIMDNNPPCQRMSLENAELSKIAVNTFITTKITFANLINELCEQLPGGDVDVVSKALGLDRRIGPKYLKGGLGYGGPCFPRDNVALSFFANALDVRADLAEATHKANRSVAPRILARLSTIVRPGMSVAVLGLAYKPLSHVVDESQGIQLAKALASSGARVIAFDPLAGEAAQSELHDKVVVMDSLAECIAQAEVILIATPDPTWLTISPDHITKRNNPVVVVDFWRILSETFSGHSAIRYIPGGRSIDDVLNSNRLSVLWGAAAGTDSALPSRPTSVSNVPSES